MSVHPTHFERAITLHDCYPIMLVEPDDFRLVGRTVQHGLSQHVHHWITRVEQVAILQHGESFERSPSTTVLVVGVSLFLGWSWIVVTPHPRQETKMFERHLWMFGYPYHHASSPDHCLSSICLSLGLTQKNSSPSSRRVVHCRIR